MQTQKESPHAHVLYALLDDGVADSRARPTAPPSQRSSSDQAKARSQERYRGKLRSSKGLTDTAQE